MKHSNIIYIIYSIYVTRYKEGTRETVNSRAKEKIPKSNNDTINGIVSSKSENR